MLTLEERTELEQKRLEWKEAISAKESKKNELYQDNKENVDTRKKKSSACTAFMTLGVISLIVGVIGLLFFDGIAFIATPIAGVVLFVLFIVLRLKPAKAVKALNAELKDYDGKVNEILGEITTIRGYISEIDYKLERDACERKWAEYNEGHICVYVGTSTNKLSDSKSHETASHYAPVYDVVVFIDGIEYGGTKKPFGAFEVTPGNHVVKIKAYYNFGGVDKYLESKAKQVKVADKSQFIFYHWTFYNNGKGLVDDLYVKVFDNPYDFLVHTHQERA